MRATLADASLARYAGRFVWLALDFDKPSNQQFLERHGVTYTPSFFVLDANEHAHATQLGGLTLPELKQFLDRGESGVIPKTKAPADAALARGDELLALDRHSEAVAAYGDALHLSQKSWPERDRALASFTWALMSTGQCQVCSETAAAEAPGMSRTSTFSRVVLAGLSCANQVQSQPWAVRAREILEPLAVEACALSTTLRDHRFQLYQQLMRSAEVRSDQASVKKWAERWVNEIDASKPTNDDERTALDVARADVASYMDDPSRLLPALMASEAAMPGNYNASLRLAQVEIEAKRYDEAIAACVRGLAHVTGPLGHSWLLQTEAEALVGKGQLAEAHRVLEQALVEAKGIGVKQTRENNMARISRAIKETEKATN